MFHSLKLGMPGRGIKEQSSLCMLFADDIVLYSSRREEVNRNRMGCRRAIIEERGLTISRTMTEYLAYNKKNKT